MHNKGAVSLKKQISSILIFVLIIGMVFSLSGCAKTAPAKEEISQLVADAVISDNASIYRDGECSAEGHKILGSDLSGNRLKVYALTTFGNYGFQNDMFVKVSGSGINSNFFESELYIEKPRMSEGRTSGVN